MSYELSSMNINLFHDFCLYSRIESTNYYYLFMNTQSLSFKRYWEPSYLQATSISLIAGAVSTLITYPA